MQTIKSSMLTGSILVDGIIRQDGDKGIIQVLQGNI
jgi:hypothetical protein